MLVSKVFIKKKPELFMQNAFFMKEALVYLDKSVIFVMLSPKQANDALIFTITSILSQSQKSLIYVSLTTPGEEVLSKINKLYLERVRVIDAFSKDAQSSGANITTVNNSDLTGMQIAIERAEKALSGEKIIIFDALNTLSVYSKQNEIGKFLHHFSNKTRLKENSAIIFTVKESTNPEIIEMSKEFADKTFDYSEMFVSAITLAES